jgi:hypothetical protein
VAILVKGAKKVLTAMIIIFKELAMAVALLQLKLSLRWLDSMPNISNDIKELGDIYLIVLYYYRGLCSSDIDNIRVELSSLRKQF